VAVSSVSCIPNARKIRISVGRQLTKARREQIEMFSHLQSLTRFADADGAVGLIKIMYHIVGQHPNDNGYKYYNPQNLCR
jgi:hypothetical protein